MRCLTSHFDFALAVIPHKQNIHTSMTVIKIYFNNFLIHDTALTFVITNYIVSGRFFQAKNHFKGECKFMENSRKSKFFLVLAVVAAIVIKISVAVVVSWYFAVITMFSLFKFAYDLDDLSTPSLSYISEKIGMEFKNCEIRKNYTKNDGLHHSHSYLEVKMPHSIDEQLENNSYWQNLPLSENVGEVCRNKINSESKNFISAFEHGYFYFDIEKHGYDFTLAVYNSDTDMIYYYSQS